MNLIEALELIKKPVSENALKLRIYLACGFTPLHLQTFLKAELRKLFPERHIDIKTGLFGDLLGNIERIAPDNFDIIAVAIEWTDIDTRLGIRNLGGWHLNNLADIVELSQKRAQSISHILHQAAQSIPVICVMPTLPLPAMFFTTTQESCEWELELKQIVASLAASIVHNKNIRVVNSQALDEISPSTARFDIKSELMTGFPYKLNHASTIAGLLALLIQNPVPKKGLITDLDDTLWSGILGEIGCDKISWSLEQHSHEHGLYQQFLSSLSSAGVLIAAASKNDKSLVERAFMRKDLLLTEDNIFPLEVHWSSKSLSVQRILNEWNLSSESVVFIDDSPMETAEVKAAFPQIECIIFPKGDYQAIWNLLFQLRNLFGKSGIAEEDSFRLRSIRNASIFRNEDEKVAIHSDEFLEKADASILFECNNFKDDRAFELINKTNQFNINGRRFAQGEWVNYIKSPKKMLLTVSYEDRYGPLGKIAVLLIDFKQTDLYIDCWVMSCRAFSRRIEHQCLKYLFDKYGTEEMIINYQTTGRNQPFRDFIALLIGDIPPRPVKITKGIFFNRSPSLFHRVVENDNGRK